MPQTWKIIVIHLYYKPIEPFLEFLVESNDICIASVKYHPQANLWNLFNDIWATKNNPYSFPLYWLVNRDPYNGLL